MKRLLILLIAGITILWAGPQQFIDLGNFELRSGSIIENCRIGYRVYGEMNSRKDNIIVIPTWFQGVSRHIGSVVGPEKLADTTLYAVIAIDALGNGVSTSPSNSSAQPDSLFPFFDMYDMVESQHQMLTKQLNISHVKAVLGGSMGGMQTFQWMVQYPDYMDYAIPYVGTPRPSSFDRLFWESAATTFEMSWKYGMSSDDALTLYKLSEALVIRTPEYLVRTTPYYAYQDYIAKFFGHFSESESVFDKYYQIKAMEQHDISRDFSGELALAAKAIHCKTLMIVCKRDHLVNPGPALEFALMIHAQVLIVDNDGGHVGISPEMKKVSKKIHKFLKK